MGASTALLERSEALSGSRLYEKMISEYDFSDVVWTIRRYNQDISENQAHEMVQAFLQWISLAPLNSKDQWITMFQTEVEEAFHSFVLNTALYQDFCERYIGFFFHHTPVMDEDGPGIRAAAKYTVETLIAEYGDKLHPYLKEWKKQFDNGTYKVACAGPGGRCR